MTAPLQPSEIICTHERRPGTTVCLHCRHAARIATRTKRKRLLLRGGAVGLVAAVCVAAAVLGASAIRDRDHQSPTISANAPVAVADAGGAAGVAAGRVASGSYSAPVAAVGNPPADTFDAAPPPVMQEGATSAAEPLTPVIPVGQSVLAYGDTAVRSDAGVTLLFDSPMIRTRRPDKFDQFVRMTLSAIYGPAVDSALARVPEGTIATSQDQLLSQLPTQGVRIPLNSAWLLRLYPQTRPGQDGALVISYRVAVVPAGQ